MLKAVRREARAQARDARLLSLGFRDYPAYIASPRWQAVRRRYRESGLPQRCAVCGGRFDVLHHRTYERVGEERLDDLAPLCRPCHEMIHDLERRGQSSLDPADLVDRLGAPAPVPRPAREPQAVDRELIRDIRSLAVRMRRGLEEASTLPRGVGRRNIFIQEHARRMANRIHDELMQMRGRGEDPRGRMAAIEEVIRDLG